MEILSIIVLFIIFGVFFFYPILVGGALYLTAYLIFRRQLKKREMRGLEPIRPLHRFLWHMLFFVVSAICAFLVGLISLDLDELLAWNIITGAVAYFVGVITYSVANLISSKLIPTDDESKKKKKRLISVIFTVFFSLTAFVIALMMGLSFVVLTLM